MVNINWSKDRRGYEIDTQGVGLKVQEILGVPILKRQDTVGGRTIKTKTIVAVQGVRSSRASFFLGENTLLDEVSIGVLFVRRVCGP